MISAKQLIHNRNNLRDKKNANKLVLDYEYVCHNMIYVKINKVGLLLYH